MLEPGSILQGRYTIERNLAEGGMGSVYLASQTRLAGRKVAIKEMVVAARNQMEREQAVKQFQKEAEMLATLEHPGLVAVLDYFEDGHNQYLVMEYIDGVTLHEVAQRTPTLLQVPQVVGWIDQVCDVLEYLHTRTPPIVFCDLKPGNLMLDPKGKIRLIDLGIARPFDGNMTATLIRGAGTPGFAPVEQYSGGATDPRSDIYAVGATMYALLTRTHPPVSVARLVGEATLRPPGQINPSVTPTLDAVILKLMAVHKEKRYQDIAEVKKALSSSVTSAAPLPVIPMAMPNIQQQTAAFLERLAAPIQTPVVWPVEAAPPPVQAPAPPPPAVVPPPTPVASAPVEKPVPVEKPAPAPPPVPPATPASRVQNILGDLESTYREQPYNFIPTFVDRFRTLWQMEPEIATQKRLIDAAETLLKEKLPFEVWQQLHAGGVRSPLVARRLLESPEFLNLPADRRQSYLDSFGTYARDEQVWSSVMVLREIEAIEHKFRSGGEVPEVGDFTAFRQYRNTAPLHLVENYVDRLKFVLRRCTELEFDRLVNLEETFWVERKGELYSLFVSEYMGSVDWYNPDHEGLIDACLAYVKLPPERLKRFLYALSARFTMLGPRELKQVQKAVASHQSEVEPSNWAIWDRFIQSETGRRKGTGVLGFLK